MPSSPLYCALTFDDGPNTTTTVQMLDILERHGVTASFFLWGDFINDQTAPVVRRAFDMGCEICNHSRTHAHFTELTPSQMLEEITFTTKAIQDITGTAPKFFRPPYISVNDEVFSTVPLPMICGINALDWQPEITAQQRFDMIMEQIRPGALVLLHDLEGNYQTVEAVDRLIPALKEAGYEFLTVSGIFDAYGITPEPHKYLYSFVDQTEKMPD